MRSIIYETGTFWRDLAWMRPRHVGARVGHGAVGGRGRRGRHAARRPLVGHGPAIGVVWLEDSTARAR